MVNTCGADDDNNNDDNSDSDNDAHDHDYDSSSSKVNKFVECHISVCISLNDVCSELYS